MVESDLPTVLEWRNHPDIRNKMLTQHQISMKEHLSWFMRLKDDATHQRLMVIDDEVPVGFVQFSPVTLGGVAEWGFYSRPDAPSGAGQTIGRLALKHAFTVLRLHKVYGQAIESNTSSISFHRRMRFSEEGRLRDHWRIADQYHTVICFGLLASEWREQILSEDGSNAAD